MRRPHVEFGMYPFESVAWAWDELWAGVHARAPWTPSALTRSGDVHARWSDGDCVVTHVCGWPFAERHHHDLHVLGAFQLGIPEALPAAHYRSVLLSPHDAPLSHLVGADRHAVANSADSLSGWLSLCAATVGAGLLWPGPATFTSAHIDSVRALARREADIAAIDSWSLALIDAEQPDLTRDLHRVGLGPAIPTPAIGARKSLGTEQVHELVVAFADVMTDPGIEAALRALHITGFLPLSIDDYRAVEALAPQH